MTEEVKQEPVRITMSPQSQEKANNAMNYTMNLINMSLQQIWNIAYQAGFEDGMSFLTEKQKHEANQNG